MVCVSLPFPSVFLDDMSPVRGLRADPRRQGAAGGPPGWARIRRRAKRCPRSPSCPQTAHGPLRRQFPGAMAMRGCLRPPRMPGGLRLDESLAVVCSCAAPPFADAVGRTQRHISTRSAELGATPSRRTSTRGVSCGCVRRCRARGLESLSSARTASVRPTSARIRYLCLGGRLLPVWRATRRRDSCFGTAPPQRSGRAVHACCEM